MLRVILSLLSKRLAAVMASVDTAKSGEWYQCFLSPQVHMKVLDRVHPLLKEPFVCPVEWREKEQAEVVVKVVFHSHYGEPPVDQRLAIRKGKGEVVALIIHGLATMHV